MGNISDVLTINMLCINYIYIIGRSFSSTKKKTFLFCSHFPDVKTVKGNADGLHLTGNKKKNTLSC